MSIDARIERIPENPYHRKLLAISGLGYTFDAMDGAVIAFVLAAVIGPWHLTSVQTGVLSSALFIGYFFGCLLAGYLGDKYGRKQVIMWSLVVYCTATLISAFAETWTNFFWWRVIAGIGNGAEAAIIAPYISELVASKYRGKYVGALTGFYSFGYVGAALLSYYIIPASAYGWRITVFLTALPVVLVVFWRRSLPESPRWLESRGRTAEADQVMSQIEKQVERRIHDKLPEPQALHITRGSAIKGSFLDLLRKPLVKSTLMLWILWFALIFAYYGFSSWLPTLLVKQGFTVTKSFGYTLIIYLAQIPGYFSAAYLNDIIGRKKVIIGYLAAAVVSAFCMGQSTTAVTIIISGFLISFFLNGATGGVYTYTPEQFPTLVRGKGTGSASAVGRIGAITAPIIIGYLYPIYGFAGVFTLLAGVLAIGLSFVVFLGKETKATLLGQNSEE